MLYIIYCVCRTCGRLNIWSKDNTKNTNRLLAQDCIQYINSSTMYLYMSSSPNLFMFLLPYPMPWHCRSCTAPVLPATVTTGRGPFICLLQIIAAICCQPSSSAQWVVDNTYGACPPTASPTTQRCESGLGYGVGLPHIIIIVIIIWHYFPHLPRS